MLDSESVRERLLVGQHKIPQWNVEHARMLQYAVVRIPCWKGVFIGTFRDMEVSEKTGVTQAYYYIDVADNQGNLMRFVARCVVRRGEVVVDHFFPPVMKR